MATSIFSAQGTLICLHFRDAEKRPRLEISSLSDLGLSFEEVQQVTGVGDTFVAFNKTLFASCNVAILITERQLYQDGPRFFYCAFEEVGGQLSGQVIETLFPELSAREAEVVSLTAQGLTLKEVAQRTNRAQSTVTIQARSAVQKTGSKSLISLVSLVCQLSLLQGRAQLSDQGN